MPLPGSPRVVRRAPFVLLLAAALAGCTCGGSPAKDPTPPAEVAPALAVEESRLDQTWVVKYADEASLGAYAQESGWVALVMKRDYGSAVRQLGPKGGLAAARAHAEAAALFRQAALAASFSYLEVYGKTPQPTDPAGVQHLLSVAHAMLGQLEEARAASDKVPADDPTAAWHAPWKAWLATRGSATPAPWPPDLSTLPVTLPEPRPGEWPEPVEVPHYSLPELGGSTSKRDLGDPGLLLALALWHDAAAKLAAGEQHGLVATLRAGYRLPGEPPVLPAGDLPDDLMFGGDLLTPGDAAFLADLHGPAGIAAVEAHASTSLLAEVARLSRGASGKIDAQKAVELVTQLREALAARATAKTAGNAAAHHRIFADIAYTGALRSLALVAEVEGDREVSGLLRINALEHSAKHTACPVGMLALAAWDASNRYPMRAQDILHAQIKRYPSLEIARYGLDVLGLRVNSERVGETPGM